MTFEERIGRILNARGLKLGIAESCTGGLIASRITNVAGSSEYFEGGFVTYSNRAKTLFLGVPEGTIGKHGAVSANTARAMARGASKRLGVDLAVAVTGIAGPGGGSPEKPVGTVFICLAAGGQTCVREFHFSGTRRKIKKQTADEALIFILDHLEGRADRP